METASQSVSDVSIDVISPILFSETLFEPLIPFLIDAIDPILSSENPIVSPQSAKKSSILKKHKRSLFDVITEVSYVKDIKFDPLQVPHISLQLRLLIDIDTDDVYVLFSLS